MSIYLLVFMGSQALGSFIWGVIASHTGFATGLLISAVLLVIAAASVKALPLRPETGTLPRGVSTAWPTPMVVFGPEPEDGPVIITNTFRVRPGELEQFEQEMIAVGRARRRTGAYSWGLYCHGGDSDVRVEQFTVPSWGEFEHQHRERWTDSDHDLITAALAHTVTGATEDEQQLFALRAKVRWSSDSTK
jgi:hypothetical protein